MEIQPGIARLQRVEGPGDEVEALGQDVVALRQLEAVADAVVAVVWVDAGHVRAVLEPAVGRQAQEAKDEAGQPVAVERAEEQPAVARWGDQHVQRDDVDVRHAPGIALELLDGEEFVVGGEGSDDDHWHKAPNDLATNMTSRMSTPPSRF